MSPSQSDLNALLSFKKSLSEPSQYLSSWSNSTNPCTHTWFGVTCNPITNRVTQLVLENLNLTGSLNSLTQLSQLRLLSLKHNRLSSFPNFSLSSFPNLKLLYLSHNRLSGIFPSGISSLRRLHRLDLSHNSFSGTIPMTHLATLPHLLTLRLESNDLSGTIDSSLNSLSPSISEFNVSDNLLSGNIPAWLSNFPASSFSGNADLCGFPLSRECSNRTVRSQPDETITNGVVMEKKRKAWLVILIVCIDVAVIMVATVSIGCCCYYKSRRKSSSKSNEACTFLEKAVGEMVVFEGCKRVSDVDDLLKSSAELLGKGGAGTSYKVEMEGGDAVVVVVKRIRERRRKRDVSVWLRMIGGLRHSNIVSLRGYYNSKDELLLVYDFLPTGSLHSLLHGNRGPGRTALDWGKRLGFASGSAKGLAFFHGYNKAKLFHGNLTSTNILVDELGNACISDIGIYQLLHSPHILNSASYIAPELIMPNNNHNNMIISYSKFTQKCDVYSFGVILLEILSGKMATGEGETSLVQWVKRVPQQEWSWEIFDFELSRNKEMEKEMVGLMQVALLCLATFPKDRPNMKMVYRMIEDIRTKGEASSSILNDLSSDSSPSVSDNSISFSS
ncbi:Leucine-rich repeat protein kinase family protein [Euphorbia peplus]|nr:Leucine-rich repeat protein kinase family protein [Euphorbia peplus]